MNRDGAGYLQGKCQEQLFEAASFLVREGAEALILGCTELPLIMAANQALPIEGQKIVVIDPTAILARKCVALSMEG